MKKIFSLVALVGVFLLMSFSPAKSEKINLLNSDCFDQATAAANSLVNAGVVSFDDSWYFWDKKFTACINNW